MKAKKFLKRIQKVCSEKNCAVGKCPFCKWGDEGHGVCIIADYMEPEGWNIKDILKAAKKVKY